MTPALRPYLAALALALVAGLLVVAPGAPATAQSLDKTIEERQRLEAELDAAVAAYESVVNDLNVADLELATLEARTLELEMRAAVVDQALVRRAREIYKRGDINVLSAVLGADGARGVIDRAELLQMLNSRDLGSLEGAKALRAQVAQSRALLADKSTELSGMTDLLAQREAALAGQLGSAKALESELRTRKARQTTMANGRQRGIYACIIAPTFRYRNTWGAPRSGGRSHKGTDVFGALGAQVYAITNGSISRLPNGGLGGIGVYLKGDDGHLYFYTHLKGYASGLRTGKRVEAGELIAFNGATGNARGGAPHIHFQVHPNGGGPVNPYDWLTPLC